MKMQAKTKKNRAPKVEDYYAQTYTINCSNTGLVRILECKCYAYT